MKLRWKSTLILILGSAFLLFGGYQITRNILLETTDKIERQLLRDESLRVVNLLYQDMATLSATAADWALWDDTYNYVQGNKPGYISANFMTSSFSLLRVDYVMLFDKDKHILNAFQYDQETKTIKPLSADYKRAFVSRYLDLFTERERPDEAINQLIVNEGQVALISSYGITNSSTQAPSNGTLVFARIIDDSVMRTYESVLDSTLRIEPVMDYIPKYTVTAEKNRLVNSGEYSYRTLENTTECLTKLLDISGSPAAVITISKNRVMHRQVNDILKFFILQLVGLCILVAILNAQLIKKFVIIPVEHIGSFLSRVNLEELSSLRLSEDKKLMNSVNSEIGTLVIKTDLMLDRIESDARKISLNEKRIKQALEASKSGIWEYHLAQKTVKLDAYALQLMGKIFGEDTFTLDQLDAHLHPDDMQLIHGGNLGFIHTPQESLNIECRLKSGKGKYHWYLVTGDVTETGPDGSPSVISGLVSNIDRQKYLEDELRFLSYHDKLTGLHNRRYFEKSLHDFDRTEFFPQAVMITDINGLKLTNDTFGHQQGDHLLTAAARILKRACRERDIICRWGGDEFAILMSNTDEKDAEYIYNIIKQESSREQVGPVILNMAVGYAVRLDSDEPLPVLIKTAEERMYRNKITESESARSSILTTILKTLNDKSIETYEHSRRIAEMGIAIVNKMNLGPEKKDEIILLSNLHDIGKIAIPENILNKPGKLSEAEWEVVRNHPEIGYRIASTLQDFAHVAPGILSHHERYDGSGYPKGLSGEQIPLTARILSVADSVDVMQHGRPYQAPVSNADVIAELERCSGTQFDPAVVSIAVDILKNPGEQ